MTGTRGGRLDPDALAALEDQRSFLLKSLEDLEREFEAGDLGEDDYRELKDDYTARAADVIRSIDEQRAVLTTSRAPVRRGVVVAWLAVVALLAVGAGLFVARSSGRRGSSDVATGEIRLSSDERLVEGQQRFQDGDLEGAIDELDDLLEEEPANAEALALRGAALLGLDRYDEGIASLEQAIDADPTFLDSWSVLLLAQQRADRQDEGLARIGELVDGGDVDIALGVAGQLGAQEPVLAIMVYDAILEREPEQPVALTYRGWLVHLAGLDDEALDYLDRAVAVDPELPDALAFRAILLAQLGRTDEAREALAAFDAVDPPPGMRQLIEQSGLRDELG